MSYYNTLKSNAPGLTGGQTIASQGYVGSFNGSSQYLTTPSNTNFNLSGVDWTIETWVYASTTPINNQNLIQSQTGTNNWVPYLSLGLMANGTVTCALNAVSYYSAQTITLNTWNHLALVRNSGVIRLFINGVASSVVVTSDIVNSNLSFWIGKVDNAPGGGDYLYYLNGYLSNLRVVKGRAVYTGTFTVPTGPLTATQSANPFGGSNTSAITGTQTSLLTLQNSTIVDNSTNALTITNNGTVTTAQQTVPFGSGTTQGTVVYDGSKWQATPIQTTGLTVPVDTLKISGGTSGYVLSTNGSSALSWITPSSGPTGATGAAGTNGATGVAGVNGATGVAGTNGATGVAGVNGATGVAGTNGATGVAGATGPVAGSDTQVIFNDAGSAGASANLTFNKTTGILNVTGTTTINIPTVDYLVVAGGGGGGDTVGGGGGAGGLVIGSTSINSGTYTITVGAGGAAGTSVATMGTNGSNSVFGSITTIGGGGGGGVGVTGIATGRNGGSGGGGAMVDPGGTVNGGSGTSGQGYSGGTAIHSPGDYAYSGGGGGGGGAGTNGGPGNGGIGIQTSITGTATYYAGGGAGCGSGDGAGGNGGGGNPGVNGSANRGGGGGGGNPGSVAGSGGSGIVVIRYADTYPAASATTGSPSITVAGGYRIYVFTSSGTITWPTTTQNSTSSTTGTLVIGGGVGIAKDVFVGGNITANNTVTSTAAHVIGVATIGGYNGAPPPTIENLIVGGGGTGGRISNIRGAGGGAGGLIYINSFPVAAGTSYTVTVGAGGVSSSGTNVANGANSVFSGAGRTLTAIGGGFGGDDDYTNNGATGGSGGGQWYPGYTGAAATQPSTTNDGISTYAGTGFGNKGGDSSSSVPYGSGGGGAGAAGGNWNAVGGPVGGIGKAYDISGTSTYYAGGGGADNYPPTYPPQNFAGGLGGGGTGYNNAYNTLANGATNTGGGGGAGGSGGSGIVIIRYADTYAAATSSPGATYTVVGGYRIYKFTSSGSITWSDTIQNSTSTTTGALIVGGGVGVVKDVFVGGSLTTIGDSTVTNSRVTRTQIIEGFTDVGVTPSIQYLVVGGGGGGGYGTGTFYGGGGGGGGAVNTGTLTTNLAVGTMTITVGGGGTGGLIANTSVATSGTNTTIVFGGTTTATAIAGYLGGNGGGDGGQSGNGNLPGTKQTGNGWGSSGGGAGHAGYAYNDASKPGQGGEGVIASAFDTYGTNTSNSNVPSSGKGYFGGGGGSGNWYLRGVKIGGYGGGGSGGSGTVATAGTINTGGGGGGGDAGGGNGGAGGSGIAIIRYPDTYSAAKTTGTVTYTVAGGYRVYAFTGSGTISFAGTVNSTSPTTGTLVVSGGVGIGSNLYVGGTIYQNGAAVGSGGGTPFVFQNSGFNYSVNGFADSTFPTLTLVRGQSYNFNLTNVTSSHPLALRLTSGSTSAVPGTTGNNPTSGVYGTTGTTTYQICGTAGEDGTATLTAPAGATFTSVEFASYGTPSGTCGSFALGGCHATNSLSIVQGYLIGQTGTVNIPATNAVFGDPCGGTSKSLAVQATATGTGGGTSVSTIVTYQVPFDAPSVIYYQCVNHSGMIGTINIVDQTGFTGATGPAGATGIGTAGATGVGTPGATGTQGIQGYIGATGPAGSGGSGSGGVGATGATGVGLTGATGPTGPAGPAGSGSGSGGGVTISNTPPASPSVGSFWYVADFGVLSVYVQNGDGTYIWLDIGGKFIPDPEISELLLDGFALGAFADVTPLLLLSAKEGNNL